MEQSIKYFFIIFLLNLSWNIFAQDLIFDDQNIAREMVIDEQFKTIQLYREGWINSYPIITMRENLPLILEFDEISSDMSNLSYVVYHCDSDWKLSDLREQEYMQGYFENQVNDIEASFNTYFSYYHYRLKLPNEDIQFTKSGNYVIAVYRDYNPDDVVFTRRFMISEAKVKINPVVSRPVYSVFRDKGHEIDITIDHSGYRIDDPYRDSRLYIYQNGIWDYEIAGLQPLFTNPDELVYDYQDENVFLAGNEFRMFNTRNTQVREYHIKDIDFMDYFMFQLKEDKANPAHLYFDREDLNGKYFIEAANVREPELEADYTYVYFTLKMPYPLMDGDIYIAGACSNWQFTEMNKMKYNSETQSYNGTLLLKQGIHNYRYIFLPNNNATFDISEIEGSHYETKNEYLILFYNREQGDRYDRLVGHEIAHSNKN